MIPQLSPEQLEQARQAAKEARRRRASFKEQIRSGQLPSAAAFDQALADPVLANMKVVDFLRSIQRVGEKKAAGIMVRYGIASNRRLRGLGYRQVDCLRAEFR
ncbi:MAG: 30S ribosomal protein S13 [Propionibacteriaceae bacterium]|jgi:hypothetical protein|nr:30S ribosomal protein S13 [Propionibacteriaceae bacterium]